MVNKRFIAALVLTAFGLTACPIDLIDVPIQDGPHIEVSATEVSVGEPVRIDLSVAWQNGTGYDHTLEEQSLGIYFCKKFVELEEGCLEEVRPEDITTIELLGGDTFEKVFRGVIVRSRQSVKLTHSFTFTSTEPAILDPVVFLGFPPGSGNYSGVSSGNQTTFSD